MRKSIAPLLLMLVLGCGGSGGGKVPVASLPIGTYSGTFVLEDPASGDVLVSGHVQASLDQIQTLAGVLYTAFNARPATYGRIQAQVSGNELRSALIAVEGFSNSFPTLPLNLKADRVGFAARVSVQVGGVVYPDKRIRVSLEKQDWTPSVPSRPAPGTYRGDARYLSTAVENNGYLMSAGAAEIIVGVDGKISGTYRLFGLPQTEFGLSADCTTDGELTNVFSYSGSQTYAGDGGRVMATEDGLVGELIGAGGYEPTSLQMRLTRVGDAAGKNTRLAAK